MNNILVTGAGGYIGRNVVKTLLDLGNKVIAVDISSSDIDPRACYVDYDIFNSSENVYNDLGKPDVCLHLAWTDGFVHNAFSHLEYLPKHYTFLKNLLHGGLKHLAVMGSMHEVGYHEGRVDEVTPTNPSSLYGIAKNSLRQALELLKKEISFDFQWLRGYYIYGDDWNNHSIFTKILEKEQMQQAMFPFTSGRNQYDFIHVNDLSLEIALTILQNKVNGIINICSGQPVSLKNKVEEFLQERNLNIKLEYGVFPERPYDSPIIYGDSSKIFEIAKSASKDVASEIGEKINSLIALLERSQDE